MVAKLLQELSKCDAACTTLETLPLGSAVQCKILQAQARHSQFCSLLRCALLPSCRHQGYHSVGTGLQLVLLPQRSGMQQITQSRASTADTDAT